MSKAVRSLHPPLDEYHRQLESIHSDASELAENLGPEAFNWVPEPGRWSIGQCLEHLTRVDGGYVKKLEIGIEQGREKGLTGDGGAQYGWLERWFIRSLEPPSKRRFKAPSKAQPKKESPYHPKETLGAFLATNRRLGELLQEANGLNLVKVKITSPLASFIKFRLGAAFGIAIAHDRRHLWQARQVRGAEGFPES